MTKTLNRNIIKANALQTAQDVWRNGFKLSDQVRKFRKEEGGSIVVFSMYVIILMIIVGSTAVYVMRAEHRRTRVQYTLDRAILAAASLKQTVPPQEVVEDYFDKAGLADVAPTIVIDQGMNYRRVSVDAAVTTAPHLAGMFKEVATITTPVGGTAVDGVEKVEISLVLDVSGSMRNHDRLVNLKVAAKEFIDTLLLNQPEEDTYSISIVPYSTQVNVGQNLLSKYTVTDEHNYSHCVDFIHDNFNTTEISTLNPLQRTGHFDPWNSRYRTKPVSWWLRPCPPIAERAIMPLGGDIDTLKDYIDDFEASGNTSTDVGIKWGAALLDPGTRSVISSLVDDGDVAGKFNGRPFDYAEEAVLKVIVVMTDGNNTSQYYLEPEVSSGMSNVWLMHDSQGRDRYSIRDDRGTPLDPSDDRWAHTYRESTSRIHWRDYPEHNGMEATQLSFVELWDHASIRYVAKYLQQPANYAGADYSYWRYGTYGYVHPTVKDVRMNNICSAVKSNNVLVYTIGFEVTDTNAAKLQTCATTASHFYRVEGVEISEAFASIAAQLNSLRLVR